MHADLPGRPVADPKRTGLRATPTRFEPEDGLFPEYAEPGAFQVRGGENGTYLLLACPGCGRVSGMTVGDPKPVSSPSWRMTGPAEAPTLAPSVNCVGCCGWHGHLVGGVFTSC